MGPIGRNHPGVAHREEPSRGGSHGFREVIHISKRGGSHREVIEIFMGSDERF